MMCFFIRSSIIKYFRFIAKMLYNFWSNENNLKIYKFVSRVLKKFVNNWSIIIIILKYLRINRNRYSMNISLTVLLHDEGFYIINNWYFFFEGRIKQYKSTFNIANFHVYFEPLFQKFNKNNWIIRENFSTISISRIIRIEYKISILFFIL